LENKKKGALIRLPKNEKTTLALNLTTASSNGS
jgi:hypothetical protein